MPVQINFSVRSVVACGGLLSKHFHANLCYTLVSGHRQVDDENKIGQRKLMYADLVVINNSVRDKPRKCRVQA